MEQQGNDNDAVRDFQAAGNDKQPGLIREFAVFILENKAWWMVPIAVVLGLMGLFVYLSPTGAAPFIYTLF